MDYKEAYDDICQKLMSAYNTTSFIEVKKAIGQIHPELRESEDERIRKELKEAFEAYDIESTWNGIPIRSIFAWLEKQKDSNDMAFHEGYTLGFEDGMKSVEQKEQKHPNGCFTCDEYKKGYEEGRRNGFTAGYNKAIKEVEQNVEQKSAEWSEEDEKMRKNLIELLIRLSANTRTDSTAPNYSYPREIDWLKSLRPQPKKNDMITPNKEFFQWIYDRLVNIHNEDPNVDYMISFKNRIEEMSFDRSHWKPSEEQIDALESARLMYAHGLERRGIAVVLESLYRDLKKLM